MDNSRKISCLFIFIYNIIVILSEGRTAAGVEGRAVPVRVTPAAGKQPILRFLCGRMSLQF